MPGGKNKKAWKGAKVELQLDKLQNLKKEVPEEISENIIEDDTLNGSFLSEASIQNIWTKVRLEDFLKATGIVDSDREAIQRAVLLAENKFKKVISILFDIGWDDWSSFKSKFWNFQDDEERNLLRSDRYLPFDNTDMQDDEFLGKRYAREFMHKQFRFIPARIKAGTENKFEATHILPLHEVEEIKKGGYGVVYKAKVARLQFEYGGEGDPCNREELPVAFKRFKFKDAFDDEVENLAILRNALQDPSRILSILATVSLGEECYTLAHLANMDLEDFLYKSHDGFTVTRANLIAEATNLADALDFLHTRIKIPSSSTGTQAQHLACFHMDLKPDNILVFRDDKNPDKNPVGIWRITDFGISTIRDQPEASSNKGKSKHLTPTTVGMITTSIKTNAKRIGQGTFQAPEVNKNRGEKNLGVKTDIYSFGCILTKIFAFGLDNGGGQELRDYDLARTFNRQRSDLFYEDVSGSPCVINRHVKKFVETLPGYKSLGGDMSATLNYHKAKDLLLLMLDPNPDIRPEALKVYNELNAVLPKVAKAISTKVRSRTSSSASLASETGSLRRVHSHQFSQELPLRPHVSPSTRVSDFVNSNAAQSHFQNPTRPLHVASSPPSPQAYAPSSPVSAIANQPSISISGPSTSQVLVPAHDRVNETRNSYSNLHVITEASRNDVSKAKSNKAELSRSRSQNDQVNLRPQAEDGTYVRLTPNSTPWPHSDTLPNLAVRSPPTPPPEVTPKIPAKENLSPPIMKLKSRSLSFAKGSPSHQPLLAPKKSTAVNISPFAERLVLFSKDQIHIHALGNKSLPCIISQPADENIQKLKWHEARLLKGYLVMKGKAEKPKDLDIFARYKVLETSNKLSFELLGILKKRSLNSMEISTAGHVAYVYDASVKLDSEDPALLVERSKIKGDIHRVFFSADGCWLFAWTKFSDREGTFQFVYIWDAADVESGIAFKHRITDSTQTKDPIKGIIPFPHTRAYILWECDDHLSVIRTPEDVGKVKRTKISKLRSLAVTPNEDMVVFASDSYVSVSPLTSRVGEWDEGKKHKLTRGAYQDTEQRSALAVKEGPPNEFTVVIAHKSGNLEEIPYIAQNPTT